jgi:hypothetical protein
VTLSTRRTLVPAVRQFMAALPEKIREEFEEYHEKAFDRCFCSMCYTGPVSCGSGTAQYAMPSGWFKLGVVVHAKRIKTATRDGYHVGYHGCSKEAAASILVKGTMLPGLKLIDNTDDAPGHEAHR